MSDNQSVQPPMRTIINANLNITNIVEQEQLSEVMYRTWDELAQLLSQHCGPYSKFAILTDPVNPTIEPTFTKDGIGIIRAVEYASPLQTFVKQMLSYIGAKIDQAAGDGTTSSMMLCAWTLSELLRQLQELPKQLTYTYHDLEQAYQQFLTRLEEYYQTEAIDDPSERYIFHADTTNPQEVYDLAFCQAYTSSHGLRELATALADWFSHTPQQAWNYLTIERTSRETTELFGFDVSDADYTIEHLDFFPKDKLQSLVGYSYRSAPDSEIVISKYPLLHSDVLLAELWAKIREAVEQERPLTVICPQGMDSYTIGELRELLQQHPRHQFMLIQVPCDHPELNGIKALQLLLWDDCDQPWRSTTAIQVVSPDGLKLEVTGIYPKSEAETRLLSPFYEHPDHPNFNRYLTLVRKYIASSENNREAGLLASQITKTKQFYLGLICGRKPSFYLGGSAYDNAQLVDVVIDAIISTKNGLQHGLSLPAYGTLYTFLKYELTLLTLQDINGKLPTDNDGAVRQRLLRLAFVRGWLTAIGKLHQCLRENSKRPDYDFQQLGNLLSDQAQEEFNEPNLLGEESTTAIPATQPAVMDLTLLRRFGEVALKFLCASRLIVPGGLYMPKNHKES